MKISLNHQSAKELLASKLMRYYNARLEEATDLQLYTAVSSVLRDLAMQQRAGSKKTLNESQARQVYYISMEFMLGRMMRNTLYNLELTDLFEDVLKKCGKKLETLYELEKDPGLGNGGLGRLAACYMDALASRGYPAIGHSIRYDFGVFRQKIVDGWQTELPDDWLDTGEPWMVARMDETIEVKFGGTISEDWSGGSLKVRHENFYSVLAVPYEFPIAGWGEGSVVNELWLWSAKSPVSLDMQLFSSGKYMQAIEQNALAEILSKVLYPEDNHFEGKSLRLKQQYFLVSASVQRIVRSHMKHYGTLDNLHEKKAIQLNDTHPALVVPELMRILLDEHGYSWDRAWHIVSNTVSYTNHTVMPEALEQWPEALVQIHLPRILGIVREINERQCRELFARTGDMAAVSRMAIIRDGVLHMANMSVLASRCVNGVSALHSRILRDELFHDYYRLDPGKFINVTNGIAHRRWLCQANPGLSSLVEELCGPAFKADASKLKGLRRYENDAGVLDRLWKIKRDNKLALADYIKKTTDITIDPDSLFDVQVKRLHEYKRQLLNVLHIVSLYNELLEDPNAPIPPRTFIFGAKASPGYSTAKRIIHLICRLADAINRDTRIRDRLKVVFMENYRVTLAELIIPAADMSEQISTAGKEASGTSNMKLMMNGAITIGTLDGANVEILEQVGGDNMFLFGMRTEQVEALGRAGYTPSAYYQSNPCLKCALDAIGTGIAGERFNDISLSLLTYDTYMLLADFEDYANAQRRASETYRDHSKWSKMALVNIAGSGIFSADRSVEEYAREIWHLERMR